MIKILSRKYKYKREKRYKKGRETEVRKKEKKN